MEIMKNMATYLVSKLRNKIYVSVANISIMIVFWCLVYNVSGSDFSEVMSFTWKFDLLAAEVQVRTVGEGGGSTLPIIFLTVPIHHLGVAWTLSFAAMTNNIPILPGVEKPTVFKLEICFFFVFFCFLWFLWFFGF